MSKDIGIRDFPKNKSNPFIKNIIIPRRNQTIILGKDKDKIIVNGETGEIDDTLFIAIKKELDKEQFVKLFHNQLQSIFELSKKALKVFAYIASITEYTDKIIFEIEKCKNFTGYSSKATVLNGVAELLEKEFIAKSSITNIYYINPQIFYRGDRLVLISDFKKVKLKEIDKNE